MFSVEAVSDNVVFDDVTFTSSLRSDVIIVWKNFLFFSKVSPQDGSRQKLGNRVYIWRSYAEKTVTFFPGHGVLTTVVILSVGVGGTKDYKYL